VTEREHWRTARPHLRDVGAVSGAAEVAGDALRALGADREAERTATVAEALVLAACMSPDPHRARACLTVARDRALLAEAAARRLLFTAEPSP